MEGLLIRPRPEMERVPPPRHGGPPREGEPSPAPIRIDFSSNVNARGPAPSVIEAAQAAGIADYPDPDAVAPREALSRLWGQPTERIRFAPGATELIHRICRVFLRPGDLTVVPGPTFGEYARAALLAGGRVHEVRGESPRFHLPLAELVRTCRELRPRLVFLCAPNSPTGENPSPEMVKEVARAIPQDGLLVLDDSFRSFVTARFDPPMLATEAVAGTVLVVRSLTKDLALAGLRAGAALGHPELLTALDGAAIPWGASAPAQAATVAALEEEGLHHLRESVHEMVRERARLAGSLRSLGWSPLPSSTNFLLCRVATALQVTQDLSKVGLRVRDCISFGLPNHVRVAVRRAGENEELVGALEARG